MLTQVAWASTTPIGANVEAPIAEKTVAIAAMNRIFRLSSLAKFFTVSATPFDVRRAEVVVVAVLFLSVGVDLEGIALELSADFERLFVERLF